VLINAVSDLFGLARSLYQKDKHKVFFDIDIGILATIELHWRILFAIVILTTNLCRMVLVWRI
jgi:hypothetical protein